MSKDRLGIGIVGSGFNARFHLQALVGVRDADVLGIWSPHAERAADAAALARRLDVGDCRPFPSLAALAEDPGIDAIWLCGPNFARVDNVEEICSSLFRGRAQLKGLACEKPLARNVAEAEKVAELATGVGLNTGYLENQCFAPAVEQARALIWERGARATGRPYLARAAEEHSGPHAPWFWRGDLQGGGVLNDMMCHSAELVRHLLTEPGAPRSSVTPVRVTGHVASLKWSQPKYAAQLAGKMGRAVDYATSPAEDFASVMIEFETADGQRVLGEASTSWSFVGAGLRLSAELLGPEYSMQWSSLDSGLKLFFSREVQAAAGEDMIEKQNAEIGQMPVVPAEAAAYGYENEDRHFAGAFLRGSTPMLTFADGVEVVRLLMAAYRSAEERRTIEFPPPGEREYVPAVARAQAAPETRRHGDTA